ncbi:PREDICTED: uncharacterized protein LOC109158026 [Ipomoea nil]|uniref:uncharacterized protein LOC109158026 n=1 Tax=Ipomoea nil TaxID=35883 RepID=UPI0009017EBA|nr:PREDICTED: uncharacterized protein LOC109158026 [Ipomoea nil]
MANESVNSSERTVSNADVMSSASSTVTSLSTAHHFISIKLTHKNYMFWRTQVVPFLDGHGLMPFVDGSHPSPAPFLPVVAGALLAPNPEHATWFWHDQTLMSMLISSLSEEVMQLAVGRRTSREDWESIEQSLASASCARSLNLLGQLQYLTQGDSTVVDYIGRARVILEDLALAGRPVGLDEMNLYVFRSLRPEFQNLTASLSVRGTVTLGELADFLGVQKFRSSFEVELLANHRRRFAAQRGGQPRRGGRGNNSGGQNQGGDGCGKSQPSRSGGQRGRGSNSGNGGPPNDHSDGSQAWISDTGATNHVTPDITALSTSEEYTGNDTLRVGYGKELPISRDINTKEIILKGNSHGGLFRLPIAASSPLAFLTARTSLSVWHDHLGNPHHRVLLRILQSCSPSQPVQLFPWTESVLHPEAAASAALGAINVRPNPTDDDPDPPPLPQTAVADQPASPDRELHDQADQPAKRPRGRPRGKVVKSTVRTHEMHTRSQSQAPPSTLTVQVCPSDPTCYT